MKKVVEKEFLSDIRKTMEICRESLFNHWAKKAILDAREALRECRKRLILMMRERYFEKVLDEPYKARTYREKLSVEIERTQEVLEKIAKYLGVLLYEEKTH